MSGWRNFAGFALAIIMAPFATALCIEVATLIQPHPADTWLDVIGANLTFLFVALVFGSVLAALPGLFLGAVVLTVARALDTRSPLFYAAAGLVAGLFMAWVDTRRTNSAFVIWDAIPFIVGGCASALTYWAVAER